MFKKEICWTTPFSKNSLSPYICFKNFHGELVITHSKHYTTLKKHSIKSLSCTFRLVNPQRFLIGARNGDEKIPPKPLKVPKMTKTTICELPLDNFGDITNFMSSSKTFFNFMKSLKCIYETVKNDQFWGCKNIWFHQIEPQSQNHNTKIPFLRNLSIVIYIKNNTKIFKNAVKLKALKVDYLKYKYLKPVGFWEMTYKDYLFDTLDRIEKENYLFGEILKLGYLKNLKKLILLNQLKISDKIGFQFKNDHLDLLPKLEHFEYDVKGYDYFPVKYEFDDNVLRPNVSNLVFFNLTDIKVSGKGISTLKRAKFLNLSGVVTIKDENLKELKHLKHLTLSYIDSQILKLETFHNTLEYLDMGICTMDYTTLKNFKNLKTLIFTRNLDLSETIETDLQLPRGLYNLDCGVLKIFSKNFFNLKKLKHLGVYYHPDDDDDPMDTLDHIKFHKNLKVLYYGIQEEQEELEDARFMQFIGATIHLHSQYHDESVKGYVPIPKIQSPLFNNGYFNLEEYKNNLKSFFKKSTVNFDNKEKIFNCLGMFDEKFNDENKIYVFSKQKKSIEEILIEKITKKLRELESLETEIFYFKNESIIEEIKKIFQDQFIFPPSKVFNDVLLFSAKWFFKKWEYVIKNMLKDIDISFETVTFSLN